MTRKLLIGIASAALVIGAVLLLRLNARPLPPHRQDLEKYRQVPAAATPSSRRPSPLDQVLPEVRLQRVSLDRAAQEFHRLTGASFCIDWDALQAAGLTRFTEVDVQAVNVPGTKALAMVLAQLGRPGGQLEYAADEDGTIYISTPQRIAAKLPKHTRVYNVRDLIADAILFDQAVGGPSSEPRSTPASTAPARADESREEACARQLMDLVKATVGHDAWIGKGAQAGSMGYLAGRLAITHTDEAHRKIEALLQQLRDRR